MPLATVPGPPPGAVPAGAPAPAPVAGGRAARDVPGDRLPRPPRRRRAGLASLSLLMIVGGAAGAGLLAVRLDDRSPVLVAAGHIGAGQQIRAEDLATTSVAADGVSLIPASEASQLIGRYAATDIPAGRLLDPQMISTTGLLKQGRAAIGVVLKPGHAPASGLRAGDVVQLIRVIDGKGAPLSDNATVGSVRAPEGGGFGSGGGDPVATILVDSKDAADIAAAAVADQIAIVLLSRSGS